jgi:NADH-quinone oxidoreductase subunit J
MSIAEVIFYAFSVLLTGAAIMVITVRNPVYAALFLVLAFFSSAAIWMLLEAEFLAIILVLVYVGAVMVLFLFVVMMLDINLTSLKEGFIHYLPVGIVVAVVMATELLVVIWAHGRFDASGFPPPPAHPAGYSNTKAVGEWLFTHFLLPFEAAGIILLIAIIAAIALTLRKRAEVKTQNPARQAMVRSEDRMRVTHMPPEPRQDV